MTKINESLKDSGIVIQARMGSSRFPGKVLSEFCGRPMLHFMINRIERFETKYPIFVATTTNKKDDLICHFCETINVRYVRGSEKNVFSRYQLAANEFKLKNIIRLTGDNPLPSEEIIFHCFSSHMNNEYDFTSTREIDFNGNIRRYAPKGLSVDIIKCKCLLEIDSNSLSEYEKEHVIPIFFNGKYKINIVKKFNIQKQYIDLSIDTEGDKQRVIKSIKNNAVDILKVDEK